MEDSLALAACDDNSSLAVNATLLALNWTRGPLYDLPDYPCRFLGLLNETVRDAVMPSLRLYLYSSIVLVFGGLIGNTLSMLVFSAREMRVMSSNVYLLLLALSDSAYLVSVFLSRTLTATRCLYFTDRHFDVVNRHEFVCRSLQHSMDLFSDYSTFLILAFTVERCIAIYAPVRYNSLCTVRRARLICAATFVLMFSITAPYHYKYMGQARGLDVCTVLEEHETTFAILYLVEALVFRIVPVFLIAFLNARIIARVTSLRKRRRQRTSYSLQLNNNQQHLQRKTAAHGADKSMQITIMLILVSTTYVIAFMPVLIQFIMWKLQRYGLIAPSRRFMLVWQNYTRSLYICGFAINFPLYTLSGRIFREQLAKIVCFRSRVDRRYTSTSGDAATTEM